MTTLILEVYDAFKSVGVDDDAARKAAGALSNVQSETTGLRTEMNERFNQMGRKFDALILTLEKRFGKIEGDLLSLKCMFGILVAGVASTVLRLYL